ncbi:MAG TPA: hypothetical protein OIM48_02105 [Clostridiaceae bacterium]|nr:hypothetical protein [Clostridium sp.]HJJ12088.1 hypothetical protein [Clostridiaceae bacterium]
MKHIKFLLIIMVILNLVFSITLMIEYKQLKKEIANISVRKEIKEFSKKTENIIYVTNGNAFNSKYNGNMTSTQLSKKISDFMTYTVPKIALDTKNMTTKEEKRQYYEKESMRKLTGIKEEEIEEFYALVNKIKDMGESNLEFESAEYDENTIKEVKERRLSAVLMIKYKNVDKKLNCYITASYTSEFVSFFSNDSN